MAVFGMGVLLRQVGGSEGADSGLPAKIDVGIRAKLADHPEEAAFAALSMERSDPSPEVELAAIDVGIDGRGRERVVDTGSPEVTAAAVLEQNLVTAGSDGAVQVWSRANGALLGKTQAPAPLVAIDDDESSTPFLAAVDRRGAVDLVDTTDPGRPRVLPLGPTLSGENRPLAVAYSSPESAAVVAVGSEGEVLRVDSTTGKALSRSSLAALRGPLPWPRGEARLDLVAGRFIPDFYDDEEGLLVATTDGAVADVDLGRGQGKTVLEPGVAPGRILSLDRDSFVEPEIAVGTTEGLLVSNESGFGLSFRTQPGPPVTAVTLGLEEGLWSGGEEGLQLPDEHLPSGPPVVRFDVSYHGIAAIHPGGLVSILASPGTGLSMADTESTPVAAFDPGGRLLIAEGYDANHVEEIRAVRPQSRLLDDEYQEEDVLQTYRPDPEWWPDAEDSEALYLNDVTADDEYVVAGGQDPDGDAAIMVWDAESGRPLHHLALGTGGLSTSLPSIVTKVMLLPNRHEIAAYSVAQGLIAIWSTESWELEDSVPIGAAGDVSVSPDESAILAVGLDEDGEGYVEPGSPITLTFVDVGDFEVDHEVRLKGIVGASISPDGSVLALADANGYIRFRTADGREQVGRAVEIGDVAEALEWRPDGDLLAASSSEGGVVLVDPESGEVSESFPNEAGYPTFGLSWSPDGSLLAALTAEEDEGDEGFDPAPTVIWTLGRDDVERRMCELSGCRPQERSSSSGLEDSSGLSSVDLVYQHEGELIAADVDGHTARIGYFGEFPIPPPAYAWSDEGFAWFSPGQISVLSPGAKKPRSWPCACNGVAWEGGEVISVARNGSALIRIDPRRGTLHRARARGLPAYSPTLLGVVGGRPVVAAFASEPERGTPSTLFELRAGVAKKLLGDAHGSIYEHVPSESPDTLAFVAGLSGGVCYSTARVGVVTKLPSGKLAVNFPPSPLGDDPDSIPSAQVAADGSVSAAIGPIGCDDSGMPEDDDPPVERYLLESGRWTPTGEEGADVQATREGMAVVEPAKGLAPGRLALLSSGGERRELAPETEGLVARP